eukprot:scaffold40822_cov155-Skeletonema_dohrnii-CCMP3373.AAC.1
MNSLGSSDEWMLLSPIMMKTKGRERGPVQNACSGVGLNEGLTQLVATAVEEKLINLPFISRLSKHGFARHHGCA